MLRVLLLGILLGLTAAQAAVFQWRDAQGQYHYGDRPVPGAETVELRTEPSYYLVKKVYDGDTVLLEDGRRIRLLNINTPEIETERKRGEPGGEEAKAMLTSLVRDQSVRLEYDVERHDKYGRTLAHLFRRDGLHLNLQLVKAGWAVANIHPPNLKYADEILAAQAEAQSAGKGIWGMDYYAPKPIETLLKKRLHGWQRLVGMPRRLKQGRKYMRLQFLANIQVLIPRRNLQWFPKLQQYLGKRVEVRGWPSRRGRSYSILVRHPSALIVLE
ncbi:MAG TPA: DUF4124 domain-containing protein [Methylothermaceae bacterium]|nr:DUF4124 domain-containing protein [Methylothermaceae bacterium]